MTFVARGFSGRILAVGVFLTCILFALIWRSSSGRSSVLDFPDIASWRPSSTALDASSHVSESSYIWQIRFQPDEKSEERKQKWVEMNPASDYVFLDAEGADALVEAEFKSRPDVQKTWKALGSRILRSDYLRYLALASRGGVYADLDAVPLRPIEEWIPAEYKGKAHAGIGLEFDQRDNTDPASEGSMEWNGMDWPVQFCQWTIYSWAKHPLLLAMVDQVTADLHDLVEQHGSSLETMQPTDSEVTRTTGPSAWTRLIFKELSRISGEPITWRNISKISEPKLFGDVLILPIDAYGGGQGHSGASSDPIPNGNVRHLFEGFWKHGWNE